ncbi:MAG: hypothetical protein KIS66_11310 [Fimbriimonadaceae bacterium]|nr:hypothetical protein [Fimbriimonadaceae bacterium]
MNTRTSPILVASVAIVASLASSAKADSVLEQIAIQLLASKFGVNTADITRVQSLTGLSTTEVAPIFSASKLGNTQVDTIVRLRKEGLGWGEVAHRIGMDPGTFNKLRSVGAFDSGPIWNNTLANRFAVPRADVWATQRRGASLQDQIAAILIARSSGRTPLVVYEEYRKVKDWEPIRTKSKVVYSDWKKYATRPAYSAPVGQKHRGKVKKNSSHPSGKAVGHRTAPGQNKNRRDDPKKERGNGKNDDKGRHKGKGHGGN